MNIRDFTCGLIAGWAQIVVGQPMDYIKVKYQTTLEKKSLSYFIKNIYSENGLIGFYRGSSSLFASFGFIIATQFVIYQASKRYLLRLKNLNQNDPKNLSITDITIAGAMVGTTISLIYCPVQYVKIQKQVQTKIPQSSAKILWREIYNNGIRNISKGLMATLGRQITGTSVYYSSYQWTLRFFCKGQRSNAVSLDFMRAGAVAGLIYWFFCYPFDIIKTKVQCGKTYSEALKQLIKYGYKGFRVVAFRAVIVNSANFLAYQKCQLLLRKLENN